LQYAREPVTSMPPRGTVKKMQASDRRPCRGAG
jgi:hypothetical protein